MSQEVVPIGHPLERCVSVIDSVLDDASGSDPIYLTTEAKGSVLVDLSRVISRLEGLRLQVLAAAGDVADEAGARSAGQWLSRPAALAPAEGRKLQRLADATQRWVRVGTALSAGGMSRTQAEVVMRAMDDLPADVEPELRGRAESHLVGAAAEFTPRELTVLGRRILDVVAPEVAEEHERRALENSERRARRRMRVTRRDLGNGLTRVTADLPTLHADLLMTQLHAYASPRRDHLEEAGLAEVTRRDPESGERLPYSRLLAEGMCSLLERLPKHATPRHGGDAATLVVTIDHERLSRDLGVARLSTGNAISVGEARRLACNAGVVPMVLSGESQPLDVGRKKRFHTPAMRKALAVRDRECRADGCDIPAAWCEAHHSIPWADARGPTNVDDGLLLCSFHHHRAHDKRYTSDRMPNGNLRFHRRT